MLPPRDGMERHTFLRTVGKDRKDLRVLPKCRAAREVDVAGVLPQRTAALEAARERVAVSVKAAHHASSRRVTASR